MTDTLSSARLLHKRWITQRPEGRRRWRERCFGSSSTVDGSQRNERKLEARVRPRAVRCPTADLWTKGGWWGHRSIEIASVYHTEEAARRERALSRFFRGIASCVVAPRHEHDRMVALTITLHIRGCRERDFDTCAHHVTRIPPIV